MTSIQKRVPDCSIFVLMKFNSPQQVERVLDDDNYHDLVGKLQAFTLKIGGEFESIANKQH